MYIPPEGSKHYDNDVFDNISNDIIHIKNAYNEEPFCFIGDFNSRTGLLDDFITFDSMVADKYGLDLCNNDLIESKQNLELQNIMTDRVSQDKCVNKNGVRLIELCRHFDLNIVNGRFGSDKGHGDWTCATANGSSVVDDVIMSSSMMQYVSNCVVHSYDPRMADVHKPLQVMLTQQSIGAIDVPNIFVENDDYQVNGLQHNMLKTKWVSNCSEQYKRNFVSLGIEDMSRKLSVKCELEVM